MSSGFLTRRQATLGVATVAGAATLAGVTQSNRMPMAFVPHGGGPWPFVDVGFGDKAQEARLRAYLESVSRLPKSTPKALLIISAHWEEPVPTVMTHSSPPMLYDYSGFPPESYSIQWPAPGAPQVAARVRALLEKAHIPSADDASRGFDHGTFVPLKLAYPKAEVPTVQLSLKKGLNPAEHLAIGKALSPLRDEGVFIVGSGMTFHNLRAFFRGGAERESEQFDSWLQETMVLSGQEREARLLEWHKAPSARFCHPREEHLIPLLVLVGAAGAEPASVPYAERYADLKLSAYHFA